MVYPAYVIPSVTSFAVIGIIATIFFGIIEIPGITVELEMFDNDIMTSYDCAEEFDKFANSDTNREYWTGGLFYVGTWNLLTDKDVFDFMDNRCYATYKSWMQNSSFEYFIEKNSPYFERYSYQEQMFNNEIACTEALENICEIKEKTILYNKSFDKHCKGVDESSPQLDKDNCWKGLMSDLENIINDDS